jgi:hypothetical protein
MSHKSEHCKVANIWKCSLYIAEQLTASSAEHSINSEPSEAVPVVAAESSNAEVALSVPAPTTTQVEVAVEARGPRDSPSRSRSDVIV